MAYRLLFDVVDLGRGGVVERRRQAGGWDIPVGSCGFAGGWVGWWVGRSGGQGGRWMEEGSDQSIDQSMNVQPINQPMDDLSPSPKPAQVLIITYILHTRQLLVPLIHAQRVSPAQDGE